MSRTFKDKPANYRTDLDLRKHPALKAWLRQQGEKRDRIELRATLRFELSEAFSE